MLLGMTFKQIKRKRAKKQQVLWLIAKGLHPYDILINPIVTEKTYVAEDVELKERKNVYYFKVPRASTKNDVKYAIQYIYGIEPLAVRTSVLPQKIRMQKGVVRKSFKKAIVTLPKGKTIDFVL